MRNLQQHYLVVDDDSTNNLICDFTIRKFDKSAKIDVYLEPEKALEFIAKKYTATGKKIHTILFLDVNMPTMSGFEFLDEFKKFDIEIRNQFNIYILSSSIEDFNMQARQYPMVKDFYPNLLKSHI